MKVVFGKVEKKRNNVLKVLDVEGRLARLGLKEQKPMLRFAEPSGEVSFLGRETFGSGHKWPLSRDSAVGEVSGTLSALLPCAMKRKILM